MQPDVANPHLRGGPFRRTTSHSSGGTRHAARQHRRPPRVRRVCEHPALFRRRSRGHRSTRPSRRLDALRNALSERGRLPSLPPRGPRTPGALLIPGLRSVAASGCRRLRGRCRPRARACRRVLPRFGAAPAPGFAKCRLFQILWSDSALRRVESGSGRLKSRTNVLPGSADHSLAQPRSTIRPAHVDICQEPRPGARNRDRDSASRKTPGRPPNRGVYHSGRRRADGTGSGGRRAAGGRDGCSGTTTPPRGSGAER
jgi:hypothetical protein